MSTLRAFIRVIEKDDDCGPVDIDSRIDTFIVRDAGDGEEVWFSRAQLEQLRNLIDEALKPALLSETVKVGDVLHPLDHLKDVRRRVIGRLEDGSIVTVKLTESGQEDHMTVAAWLTGHFNSMFGSARFTVESAP